MAKKSSIAKSRRTPKFSTRKRNRCWKCGRDSGFIRDFKACRICVREMANRGQIPGMRKASW